MIKNNKKFEIEYVSSSGVYKTPFTLVVFFEFFISFTIILLINLWYINSLYYSVTGERFIDSWSGGDWWYWLLLPLNIYGNIFLFFIINLMISKIIYSILNVIHPPKEGLFDNGSKDWKFMHRRFWTVYFPIWLARALPLPWSDIFVYRVFGIKVGKNVVLYEGYIDPEFIEIGNDTMTSLHVCIFSHLIYHDRVFIKKVKIGKKCIISAHSIILPGTVIKDEAILGANSYTNINQILESNLIHTGLPAIRSFNPKSIEELKSKVKDNKIGKNQY
ncbi:MAG: hypothetical protein KGD63_14125 [Candidatus Lokiarchaeota archaeon]|nr:hypothetical protein [Candidatus Lokiarchaeota archaeon]